MSYYKFTVITMIITIPEILIHSQMIIFKIGLQQMKMIQVIGLKTILREDVIQLISK